MPLDSEKVYDSLVKAGEDWADKEAAAALLEETRKSVIARLMNEAAQTSVAGKEMQALSDESYVDFVTGMVNARKAANKAKVRYDSAKVLAELRRSEESTRRAEMTFR
jgi:hypothetical protein